jgi:Ala-tRNA(Pro) deacylase
MRLQSYLDRMGISYRLSQHDMAFTAQDLAQKEHVSGDKVIKPVLVEADGQFVLCALPASYRVDLDALRKELGAQDMRMVDEQTLRDVFEDCDLGAEPPIGAIFGIPTIMDDSLAALEQVTFQAGNHAEAVTMRLDDYRRIAQPGVGHFGKKF